jgi:hypothetical protein
MVQLLHDPHAGERRRTHPGGVGAPVELFQRLRREPDGDAVGAALRFLGENGCNCPPAPTLRLLYGVAGGHDDAGGQGVEGVLTLPFRDQRTGNDRFVYKVRR